MNIRMIVFSLVICFISCSENEFKEKGVVDKILNDVAIPQQKKMLEESRKLKELTISFSTNVNKANVTLLRDSWLNMAKVWANNYVFNIGDIKDKKYFKKFNSSSNIMGIENLIKSDKVLDETVLTGFDLKGLYAIEYLLYKDNVDKTIMDFNDKRRIKYLNLIVDDLFKNVNSFESDWKLYAPKLKKSKSEKLSIDSPINLLFNGIYNVLSYTRETKIGKCAGLEKKEFVILSGVEARYSKQTLAIIRENIKATKIAYFKGFSERIKSITKNNELNESIENQYIKIEGSLNSLNLPLYDALQDSVELEKIKILHKDLKKLERIFLTDVRSTLSLVFTGTDGDGD